MRPKKPDDAKQSIRFEFTCTPAEAAEIRALAKAHGVSQHCTYLRLAALGAIPVNRNKIKKMLVSASQICPPAEPWKLSDFDLDAWERGERDEMSYEGVPVKDRMIADANCHQETGWIIKNRHPCYVEDQDGTYQDMVTDECGTATVKDKRYSGEEIRARFPKIDFPDWA